MDELKEQDPQAVEPEPIEPEGAEPTTAALITQFFLIPLLVIGVSVGVFVLFGMLTGESRSASDYLSEVRSGSKTRRFQAAFELSKMLDYDRDAAREPGFVEELGRVFVDSRDKEPEMRRYLALALGRVADPRSVEPLLAGLADPDAQTRIYAIWALGAIGEPAAAGPIAERLQDDDAGVRKMAAHALGALGEPSSSEALRGALEDSEIDVRWNAALALGRLGDPAGVPLLDRMLDRTYLERVEGVTPQQVDEVLVNAIRVRAMLPDEAGRELIRNLADGDPSVDVRSVAREVLGEAAQAG